MSQLSLSTTWVPGTELKSLGLATSTLTCSAITLDPPPFKLDFGLCECTDACVMAHVEISGQLWGAGFLLQLPCGSWKSNSSCQASSFTQ